MLGQEVSFHEVVLGEMATGQRVVVTQGVYFGNDVELAGEIQRIELEGGEFHVHLGLTGTPADAILKAHTQDPSRFRVHKCPQDCGQVETGDNYVHAKMVKLVTKPEDQPPWCNNLKGVAMERPDPRDELADLRKRQEALGREGAHGEGKKESESEDEKAKKKKKKKKRKKSEEEDGVKLDGSMPLKATIKDAMNLFGGTGMDPKEKTRKRVIRKARRHIEKKEKKKEETSSESGSKSKDSIGSTGGLEGLYAETSRAKAISERFPGVLCAEALRTMQETPEEVRSGVFTPEKGAAPDYKADRASSQHHEVNRCVMVGGPPDNVGTTSEPHPGAFERLDATLDLGRCRLPGHVEFGRVEDFSNLDQDGSPRPSGEKVSALGLSLLQRILEVFPLRSKTTGGGDDKLLFPLPTSRGTSANLCPGVSGSELNWLLCVVVSLNSLWGGPLFNDQTPNAVQEKAVPLLRNDVKRFCELEINIEDFDWDHFFSTRSIDYQGDEVRVAKKFKWKNIAAALPNEIGRVPLQDVCTHGAKHYVEHFSAFFSSPVRLGLTVRLRGLWSPTRTGARFVEDWFKQVCAFT